MKSSLFFVLYLFYQVAWSDSLSDRVQPVFGDTAIQVLDYDERLKEVVVGTRSYFATDDGRYVFSGPIMDTETGLDIVELRAQQHRKKLIESSSKTLFLSYPSSVREKHRLVIFTDIDCPFCRKMHAYMDEFNRSGITVDYIMLPRAGLISASARKTVSALCGTDPLSSMTRAMNGEILPTKVCDTTLAAQYELAIALGINSTPVTVMPNGRLKYGLTSPATFLSLLNKP